MDTRPFILLKISLLSFKWTKIETVHSIFLKTGRNFCKSHGYRGLVNSQRSQLPRPACATCTAGPFNPTWASEWR